MTRLPTRNDEEPEKIALIPLVLAIILNSTANILIKNGMRGADLFSGGTVSGLIKIASNLNVFFGALSFGISLVFYSVVLSKMELSVAYPIMTGSGFIIVMLSSVFIFGEPFLLNRIFGMALIFVGIAIVAWK